MPESESEIGERQPGVPNTPFSAPHSMSITAENGSLDLVAVGGSVTVNGEAIDSATIAAVLTALAGGTTGQVLTKASNADLDFGWETP